MPEEPRRIHLLIISGSRINGAGENLIRQNVISLAHIPPDIRWEIAFEYLEQRDLPLFYHADQAIPATVADLFTILQRADGILLISPTYWWMPSPCIVNFLAWLYHRELPNWPLAGKIIGILVTCQEDGGQKVINDLWNPTHHLKMIVPQEGTSFFNTTMAHLSENQWMIKDAPLILIRIAQEVYDHRRKPASFIPADSQT